MLVDRLDDGPFQPVRIQVGVEHGFDVGRVCDSDVEWFEEHSRNLVVRFRENGIPDGIHLEDIKYTNGEYRVAGETGEVLVVTGRGETMRAAQQQAYDRADDIILPNKFYRSDIGDRWYSQAEQLLSWGYLQES